MSTGSKYSISKLRVLKDNLTKWLKSPSKIHEYDVAIDHAIRVLNYGPTGTKRKAVIIHLYDDMFAVKESGVEGLYSYGTWEYCEGAKEELQGKLRAEMMNDGYGE